MDQIKIVECQGYTKQQAFADLHFDPACVAIRGSNATQAWVKEGKPIPGTLGFKQFAAQQLMEKTKCVPGFGLYIVLTPPVQDTRRRPYSLVNMIGRGTREWILQYQIREDVLSVNTLPNKEVDHDGTLIDADEALDVCITEIGPVIAQYDSKLEAITEAKRLTAMTHKNYSIVPIKVPDKTPISAYVLYTPAKNTQEGVYIAFGIDHD